jgi:tetratricopeptide (TPR) repeat protein
MTSPNDFFGTDRCRKRRLRISQAGKKHMTTPNEAQTAWEEYMRRTGMPSCAFSTRKIIRIGTGTTTQKKESKVLWVGTQVDEDVFEVQRVNKHMAPAGEVQTVPADRFYHEFHPEVELYHEQIVPVMRTIRQSVERGDHHRERGEPYSAEFEYNIALQHDEQCVRALFGMGLVYLARNETDKARNVFSELVGIKAPFAPEHKHLFNEFGIQMRKRGMYDEAVAYFERGLEFDTEDENLFFNAARANYEKGNYHECARNLAASLDLNAAAGEAREFARYLATNVDRIVREAQLERHGLATSLRKAVGAIDNVVKQASHSEDTQSANHERLPADHTRTQEKRLHYDRETGNVDILG